MVGPESHRIANWDLGLPCTVHGLAAQTQELT